MPRTSYADARKRVAKWRSIRRSNREDATVKAMRKEAKAGDKLLRAAREDIEAAGFNDERHYFSGGIPSYCACGSVADHNAIFDKLIGRVK